MALNFVQLGGLAGCSSDIVKELILVVRERYSEESLTAVVCDSTNVDTGHKHGIIRTMEEQLLKHLQWLVCLLHCNELPL